MFELRGADVHNETELLIDICKSGNTELLHQHFTEHKLNAYYYTLAVNVNSLSLVKEMDQLKKIQVNFNTLLSVLEKGNLEMFVYLLENNPHLLDKKLVKNILSSPYDTTEILKSLDQKHNLEDYVGERVKLSMECHVENIRWLYHKVSRTTTIEKNIRLDIVLQTLCREYEKNKTEIHSILECYQDLNIDCLFVFQKTKFDKSDLDTLHKLINKNHHRLSSAGFLFYCSEFDDVDAITTFKELILGFEEYVNRSTSMYMIFDNGNTSLVKWFIQNQDIFKNKHFLYECFRHDMIACLEALYVKDEFKLRQFLQENQDVMFHDLEVYLWVEKKYTNIGLCTLDSDKLADVISFTDDPQLVHYLLTSTNLRMTEESYLKYMDYFTHLDVESYKMIHNCYREIFDKHKEAFLLSASDASAVNLIKYMIEVYDTLSIDFDMTTFVTNLLQYENVDLLKQFQQKFNLKFDVDRVFLKICKFNSLEPVKYLVSLNPHRYRYEIGSRLYYGQPTFIGYINILSNVKHKQINKEDIQCSICLCEGDLQSNCNHVFCQSCLKEWFHVRKHTECPYCRQIINDCSILEY
jgi:hypothetical protein